MSEYTATHEINTERYPILGAEMCDFTEWLDESVRLEYLDETEEYWYYSGETLIDVDTWEWFATEKEHSVTGAQLDCWYHRKFYAIPCATFSDHSGSLVERSNARSLEEDSEVSEYMSTRHGHYGTEWHGFWIEDLILLWLSEDGISELDDILGALANYPLLDEELHSEMEMDAQDEAWKDWVGVTFAGELEARLAVLLGPADWLDCEGIECDEELADLFWDAAHETFTEWYNEEGSSMWIDVEKIAESITDVEILALKRAH
jgi:hypothetical protein